MWKRLVMANKSYKIMVQAWLYILGRGNLSRSQGPTIKSFKSKILPFKLERSSFLSQEFTLLKTKPYSEDKGVKIVNYMAPFDTPLPLLAT